MTPSKKTQINITEEKKVNWDSLNPEIAYSGRAITLPGDPAQMPTEKAIEALGRKLADELQKFQFIERFTDAYPLDAAVAFVKAMHKLYGWASPVEMMGFFGPKPPSMITVQTGHHPDDIVSVPMGAFKLPGIEENVKTGINDSVFLIYGEFPKKNRQVLLELAAETKKILKENSIYRGKPIKLMVDVYGNIDENIPPKFLNVRSVTEEDLIFDTAVQQQIDVNMLTVIRETERCRQEQIPLKRGILAEGPYGVGKSLLAKLTARVAEDNGWTFILLDKIQGLKAALEFAVRYQPAIVFAEDIDRIIEERDEAANDLINIMDGVVNKDAELMTILTTNFVEKINPVILRPGRLDAIISLRPPTAEACQRLIRHYARETLPQTESLHNAAEVMVGLIPASIREAVERAKLGMISRKADYLNESDIVIAAQSMQYHMQLLAPKVPDKSNGEQLAHYLRKVTNGHDEMIEEIADNSKVTRTIVQRRLS